MNIETAKPAVYACCDLANTKVLTQWAETIVPKGVEIKDDFHVTVAFSRDNVNLSKLPTAFSIGLSNNLHRKMDKLGEAVVLLISPGEDAEFYSIWNAFRRAGASWDFPEYKPHVTITTEWDISSAEVQKIPAYQGPLLFLPYEIRDLDA